jgi:hypothetical protein
VAVPGRLTATAGAKIAAASFNSGVRDPINFLMSPPRCHVFDNTGIAAADGAVDTLLTFSGEAWDTDSMHSTASNTSRIVFTTAGTYDVHLTVQWPNATYTVSNITVRLNAAGAIGGGTGLRTQNYQTARVPQMRFFRFFSAGDYVEFWVAQTSGASRTTVAGAFATYATAIWVAET